MGLPNKPSKKRAYWSKLVSQWKASNLSQRAFCDQHDITYTSFLWWRKRLKDQRELAATNLVPVILKASTKPDTEPLPPTSPPLPERINVYLSGGVRIELPLTVSPKLLQTIIRGIGGTNA